MIQGSALYEPNLSKSLAIKIISDTNTSLANRYKIKYVHIQNCAVKLRIWAENCFHPNAKHPA